MWQDFFEGSLKFTLARSTNCTMGLATEVWKFLKVNVDFVLEKLFFFLCRMQNHLNFRINIWFPLFCQISEVFCKRRERGVWQLWNLVCKAVRWCPEKRFKIAFSSVQPFMEEISSKYFCQFYHQRDNWWGFYQPHSTVPHYIHQL